MTASLQPEVSSGAPPYRFAVAASFTAEPLEPVLRFWGAQLSAPVDVRFAPFNQVIQTLLDPSSVFAANTHGVNVLLARVEDLGSDPVNELTDTVRGSLHHLGVPLIVCLCPPSPDLAAGNQDGLRAVSAHMEAAFQGVPGVQFLPPHRVAKLYPVDRVYDPHGDRLGRIPYTELYFAALGTAIVRVAHSLSAPPFKVIALDCDNTLWSGITGEDGPTGVSLDPARRALHRFMLEQRDDGMLLCLASKNNEADVIETFDLNPDFPLRLRHFTSWRLNWESKAENLESLSSELSLGLDSFIFVDDNPRECAEVEDAAPEVLTLALPANAEEIPQFLDHVWAFDHPVVTEEDRNRSAYYTQTRQFGREMRGAGDLQKFIAGLKLDVRFAPIAPDSLPRAAQMTQRTNQFNFTTVRRSETEIQELRDAGFECVTVDVSDRFGAYGIVGLLIFGESDRALDVDTFLLSCRALGRGVEHRMLAFLAGKALDRGLATVRLRAKPTAKNRPARQFIHDVAARYELSDGSSLRYDLPAAEFRDLQWQAAPRPAAAPAAKPARTPDRRFVEYAHIARNLSTPAQIVAAMRRPAASCAHALRMTSAERRLAAIWSDLLHRPGIRPADNFYDLGGHSLLAVLLTLRVREEFGVELPIDDVYSAGLTLAELARKIETYQLARVSPEEYRALLAEIENMSDEEVLAALAREGAEELA